MFIEHVNLTVADLERSIRFYARVFGFEVRWRGQTTDGKAAAHIGDGHQYLALFQAREIADPPAPRKSYDRVGFNHFGYVVDDLDALKERLATLKVKITEQQYVEIDGKFAHFICLSPFHRVVMITIDSSFGFAYDERMQNPEGTIRKPVIGITMGDPLGIGPEVVVKALADPDTRRMGRFVIYGLNELLTYVADDLERHPFWFRVQHDSPRLQRSISDDVVVLDYDEHDGFIQIARRPCKSGGVVSKLFVEDAIEDAMRPVEHSRHLDAIVTGPISKEAWRLAGYKWPGHTELFAHRTKAKRCVMMFVSPRLNVALATCHLPLMDIRNVLTIGRVFDPIDLGHEACKMLGIENPRIAVTGLNPHAGEQGLLGDEESRLIEPAIRAAIDGGMDASGPFPADTLFIKAASGEYDLVVAMYHDQGLTPVKLLGWDKAVNWSLGLPIIRTSPDHGTAFEIAGKNKASEGSMKAAIELAAKLASQRIGSPAPASVKSTP
jgi:4-hydroxythreonine-4-phosphate dehydrogenase